MSSLFCIVSFSEDLELFNINANFLTKDLLSETLINLFDDIYYYYYQKYKKNNLK